MLFFQDLCSFWTEQSILQVLFDTGCQISYAIILLYLMFVLSGCLCETALLGGITGILNEQRVLHFTFLRFDKAEL